MPTTTDRKYVVLDTQVESSVGEVRDQLLSRAKQKTVNAIEKSLPAGERKEQIFAGKADANPGEVNTLEINGIPRNSLVVKILGNALPPLVKNFLEEKRIGSLGAHMEEFIRTKLGSSGSQAPASNPEPTPPKKTGSGNGSAPKASAKKKVTEKKPEPVKGKDAETPDTPEKKNPAHKKKKAGKKKSVPNPQKSPTKKTTAKKTSMKPPKKISGVTIALSDSPANFARDIPTFDASTVRTHTTIVRRAIVNGLDFDMRFAITQKGNRKQQFIVLSRPAKHFSNLERPWSKWPPFKLSIPKKEPNYSLPLFQNTNILVDHLVASIGGKKYFYRVICSQKPGSSPIAVFMTCTKQQVSQKESQGASRGPYDFDITI